ncbi:MAG: 3-deoxy-manno-octulosonate cytidylyltransferase [Bacteroidales bacterium]|nr:3-deoxy-manno-octulosonate cytidylyltransferase [Bacteroidales bacterium]
MKKDKGYKLTGIIPARYASSRFPGKPLASIGDRTMIQRVYEQTMKALDTVYVATDDRRIFDAVLNFGGRAVITSADHQSGTDRCAEAVGLIALESGISTDIVINIQGDEPFIKPEQITMLVSCFSDRTVEIATLVRRVRPGEDIFNPNHPKVVLDANNNALYFSRAAVPFFRDAEVYEWSHKHQYYKHIGLYGYKSEVLKKITELPASRLEKAESLEQNRWLENGYRIRAAITDWESFGIDTPGDLEKAKSLLM